LRSHTVTPAGWSSPLGRVLSGIRLGILARYLPTTLIDEALALTDRGEQRFRALPSRLGIYFVLALCLLRAKSSTAVITEMIPPDLLVRLSALGWRLPCRRALTALRDRIGVAPLRLLFDAVTQLAPTRARPWSHAFGLLVVAWDGTEIEVADTAANRARFRPHRGRDGIAAGAPKIRLLVLLACGSRRLIGAVTGTLGQGETTLAHQLAGRVREGMLLLADRAFLGYPLWTAARAQGAHLLWRAKRNKPLLPVRQPLPDGSWLSVIHDPADARAWRRNVARNRRRGHQPPRPRPVTGIVVRVVEALITVTVNGVPRTERYLLVTSLLDPAVAPADQLVALYARRWAAETGIREIKTVLLAKHALRGATPMRALQELWATLVVYQAIRLLICQAALTEDLDPSRISFTAALTTAQHKVATTPAQVSRHLAQACTDLRRDLITRHIHIRVFPRARKNTLSRYPHRGKTWQLTSGNASYQVHIVPHTTSSSTAPDPAPTAQPRAA
jgi:hypothetical protein